MSDYHALASPSSAAKWLACPNSLALEIGQPEGDTRAADLGTDKHELLSLCLTFSKQALDYEGHVLGKGHAVDAALAGDVQTVLDNVRERQKAYELRGAKVTLLVETDVPVGRITGEEGATGRCDVRLIAAWPDRPATKDVIDAKFGYQEVSAEQNPQLMMYAAGSLEELSLTEDFAEINLVIEQPLRHSSEWATTPAKIAAFVEFARPRAEKALAIHALALAGQRALREEDFLPSEKGCQWCKAKASCPALKEHVEAQIEASFDEPAAVAKAVSGDVLNALPLERLGAIFAHLELVEDWAKAVRARIEAEVLSGRPVPGVKLVAGRKGNRTWASEEEAEALMKKFKMKSEQIYSYKLLGPKTILEALKDQPRRLKQIEQLVIQPDGKPHVALDSDKRPAIEVKPLEDGFETVDDLC